MAIVLSCKSKHDVGGRNACRAIAENGGQIGLEGEPRWRVGLYYVGGALLVLDLIVNSIALPASYWEPFATFALSTNLTFIDALFPFVAMLLMLPRIIQLGRQTPIIKPINWVQQVRTILVTLPGRVKLTLLIGFGLMFTGIVLSFAAVFEPSIDTSTPAAFAQANQLWQVENLRRQALPSIGQALVWLTIFDSRFWLHSQSVAAMLRAEAATMPTRGHN